uniref:Uncharacterized protein n=1 Tax=Anguilla anguilla TaxID=7936 RepID=A0A0E9T6G3_ANGAN
MLPYIFCVLSQLWYLQWVKDPNISRVWANSGTLRPLELWK